MANLLTRVLLFLSSYFPLSAMFFILLYDRSMKWAVGIAAAGTIGLLVMVIYLIVASRLNPSTIEIDTVRRKDGEAMSYIATYLLPFLAMPLQDAKLAICAAIFIAVLGIIYVNSDMIHINPMLSLLGYRIYEVQSKSGDLYAFITRGKVKRGATASVIKIGDTILMGAKQ